MNKKYYTPNISNIYIGYKCEIESNGVWSPEIIEGYDKDTNVIQAEQHGYYLQDNIRTPYLDADQIEKEGWTPLGVKSQYFPNQHSLGKDNLWLVLDTANEIPSITIILQDPSLCKTMRMPESFRVCLNCPSINEFRTILNLVNAK